MDLVAQVNKENPKKTILFLKKDLPFLTIATKIYIDYLENNYSMSALWEKYKKELKGMKANTFKRLFKKYIDIYKKLNTTEEISSTVTKNQDINQSYEESWA